jgi:replicative superfamily II helicase
MAYVLSQPRYRLNQCIYAVPLRALASEKGEEFRRVFGRTVAISSSDYRDDDPAIMNGTKRIVVVVYEKLYFSISGSHADILSLTEAPF